MDQMEQLLDGEAMSPEMGMPDEIRDMLLAEKMKRLEQIEQIGQAVAKKRDEAVQGRAGSGIEQEWLEDDESYEGIDDANRGSMRSSKPTTHTGSSTYPVKNDSTRSTVFLNITRPYTDAASARVSDMLLPTDDKNWSIKPTPIPQLEQFIESQSAGAMPPAPVPPAGGAVPPGMPGAPSMGGMPAPQQGMPGMPGAMGGMPGAMPPQPPVQQDPLSIYVQQATEILAQASRQAEAAEKQIEDWLVECQWHAEVRKAIENCAKRGTGVMKGPTPVKRKRRRIANQNGEMALVLEIDISPASKSIDPWRCYPDPNCGESIHNGQYFFEEDDITSRQLRDLKGLPGYIDEMIDKVLEEGPGKKNTSGFNNNKRNDDELYKIWYGYVLLEKDDLETMGVECDCNAAMPAVVTLVNDTAIKAHLNPLDSGEFPYDFMPWQRRADSPWGIGVARQVRTAQRMLNAATRNMMDNAALSGGPQIIMRRNAIEPVDGKWTLAPRKFWYAKDEADYRTVADAITTINIPNMQGELMNIIQFAIKMAEDTTGLPQLLQGSMANQAPDTVGGMQMLQNNASTVLRRIARTFDDMITEPHIRRYYEYLMTYGDEELKGDYVIDARGSTALVERDLQNQSILQMGNFVLNPAFELSPSKWIKEALKAQRLDPKRFELDDEEKQAMAQQQPPPPPQIAAAQIRAETELKKTEMMLGAKAQEVQMEVQVDQMRIQSDTDRDRIYVEAETQRTMSEHQARMQELMVKRELEMLKYANQNKVTLDQIKADLAKEAMKLRTQKELAAASNALRAPQVATPSVEPPGRAPNGMAFQK